MSALLTFSMRNAYLGELVIDHSARRNAMTMKMWEALPSLLEQAAAEKSLRLLVLRGKGKYFCAGADISEFERLNDRKAESVSFSTDMDQAITALAGFERPTLAMIRGGCFGAGCALALACDFRHAASGASFAITPAKLGLTYPFEDLVRLVDQVGIANAKQMLFLAKQLDAKEALEIGLIDKIVDDQSLDGAATLLANQLSKLSRQSFYLLKAAFSDYQAGQRKAANAQRQAFLEAFSNKDFHEGYAAFLEKRGPSFNG